jgi:hypothetical protein
MLPYGVKVPEVAIQGLAEHNVTDTPPASWTRLGKSGTRFTR